MFDLKTERSGESIRHTLVNLASGEFATVAPAAGAHVSELVLYRKGDLMRVLRGYTEDSGLKDHKGYRSARLMPFPNRIQNGQYSFMGKTYQLPINRPSEGHAIHGLLFNKPFFVHEMTTGPESARLGMHYEYPGDVPGYPFTFRVELTYSLLPGGFRSQLKVSNTGNSPMPFGDGWHPYFELTGKADAWSLKLPPAELLELDESKIPTGNSIPFTAFEARRKIGDQVMDIALKLIPHGQVVTEVFDPQSRATLGVWQETGPGKYNFLQIYIPAARDCIAIEPMTCAPNAFNNNMGLIVLEPGQSMEAALGVYLF
jgi:aldose 1-epimerase